MDLLRALDNEWQTLPTTPPVTGRYARWQEESDLLQPLPTLAAVVSAAQRRGDPRRSDRLLAELARRSPSDEIAGRALLQSLMPAVRCIITENYRLGEYNDVVATTVAVMWERIRTYPIERRPQRIAANIVLDTRQGLRRAMRPLEPMTSLDDLRGLATTDHDAIALIDTLDVVSRVIHDQATLALLMRTRHNDETVVSIARASCQSANALRERRRRAERRLRVTLGAVR